MVDQIQSMKHRSVKAAILSQCESKVDKELLATDDDIHQSSLLYCAPEAIDTSKWRDVIASPDVSSRVVAVVVDEAHRVSKLYVNNIKLLLLFSN